MTFDEWRGDRSLQGYHARQAWNTSAAIERARIREELLAELGEPGQVEWRHLRAALDRICPECDAEPRVE